MITMIRFPMIANNYHDGKSYWSGRHVSLDVRANHLRFEVFVKCGHRWGTVAPTATRFDAERTARDLRHEGFWVEICEG